MAQSGTTGRVVCNSSTCATSYFMWYGFLPSSAVFCSGAVNTGDNVLVDVVNQARDGGSSTKYNISSAATSGAMCTVTGQSYTAMSNPDRGAYINERACQSSCGTSTPTFYSLAKFTTDTLQGWIYYDTSLKSISTPWSTGYNNEVKMNLNSATPNISHSTTPGSTFNEIWQHSNGT